jgi:hypothetical protein
LRATPVDGCATSKRMGISLVRAIACACELRCPQSIVVLLISEGNEIDKTIGDKGKMSLWHICVRLINMTRPSQLLR